MSGNARSGRRPLPTPLKLLRGTLETSRENKREAKPKVKIPRPPSFLTDVERKEYRRIGRRLAVNGLATEIDDMALALLARSWRTYIDAGDKLKGSGPVVKAPSGFPVQNPYFAIQNKAQEQLHKMLVEFGMTPSSRSRVRSNNETPEDALERLTR